jgi:hypothetical protein
VKKLAISRNILGILFLSLFIFWLLWLNHVGVNEIGITYNSLNGRVTVQENPGWYITNPCVREVNISTLPIRLTIPSSANVIVTRMARFRKEGAIDFVNLQGFEYRLSSSFENILLGYAFSGETYSFLEIIQEAGPEKTPARDRP